MYFPLNQNCSTFNSGTTGLYSDACLDVAEYVTIGAIACFMAATFSYNRASVFAAGLVGTSLFRCFYGSTTGFGSVGGVLLSSREIAVPTATWVLTSGHIFFRESHVSIVGCIAFCTTYSVAVAYTSIAGILATASAVCTFTNERQPLLAF